VADDDSPPNDRDEQRDASPDAPPDDVGRRGGSPGYEPGKEGYAGISSGALDHIDDLRAARDFAEMIVDTVREALLILDLDLRVKAANESFYQAFGVDPEETVGRLVYDLGNGQWDIPELRELLEDILPSEKVLNDYEVDHEFEGVGRRQMFLNARQLDDHEMILLAIEDVSERRQSERALRESEERFRLLVANAKEYAIFTMDEDARVTMWSPGAERVLGWSREEALGQPGTMIFTEEERAAGVPEQELAKALSEGSALDERWHVRKDGSQFWATGTTVALENGSLRGFAKILRDNTKRKEDEDALRRLNVSLEGRVQARTAKVRELSRALAMAEQEERRRIAHVLHDDLQQVLFGAQLADALGDTERFKEIVAHALELTRSLSHELSPPLLQGEDLEELLRWLAQHARERYGLDVEVEVRGDVRVPEADLRVLLYQLLRELLFNVTKHAGTDRARVIAERTNEHVRLVVEDEGAGFDPAELDEASNVGLGLPSVRERLELVGGELEVASSPDEGTRITITVPVEGEAAERA
jgi:PAS domain S-box-containing protein